MSGRTIAMGDIHGCCTALVGLLDVIDLQPADELVLLGDYVDRGPDSRGVLDLLIDVSQRYSVVALLGNHETMMLAA